MKGWVEGDPKWSLASGPQRIKSAIGCEQNFMRHQHVGSFSVKSKLVQLLRYRILRFLQVITPVQLMYTAQGAGDSFCMTDIHTDLTTLQGAMAEVLATGLLVFFACGLWDCRNAANTDSAPMRLGFCITVLCLIFIPYTGCSLNPARTLGPAIWNGYWTNHWVFWIGPIGGAIVSSLLYRCLFLCKTTESE